MLSLLHHLGLLVALSSLTIAQNADISPSVSLTSVDRELDIKSQIVKSKTVFDFESSAESVSYFVYALEPNEAAHLSFLEAKLGESKTKLTATKVTVKGQPADSQMYKIEFSSPVKSGKLTVEAHFSHMIKPYPAEIAQPDPQLVEYDGSAYVYSPYAVKAQKTTIKLPTSKAPEHWTRVAPSKLDGDSIVYGSYDDVQAFTQKPIRVHYENNGPFLVITKMTRLIEVSHWGNVAVEEYIEMVNTGAKLKGPFSRFDYQRDHRGANQPSVASFKSMLPASARDVYYRDEIGNISTSHMLQLDDAVELVVRPRFPLFGGWQTQYLIGYNLPSYEYLFHKGNNYALKMRFIDHVFDNMVIDDLTVKIILPEKSEKIHLNPPYKVKRSADQRHYTYLDYTGRPVIIVHKTNMVEKHIQEFEIHYQFDRTSMIYEPLMIVISLYALFAVVIVWVRLDFTIAKDEISESRMRVQGLIEKVTDLHVQRLQAYDWWLDGMRLFRETKEASILTTKRKKAETDMKNTTQQITELQTEIKAESPETADKLNELQRLDKIVKDQLLQFNTQNERLVKGQSQKNVFAEAEKKFKLQFDDNREKMDAVVYGL